MILATTTVENVERFLDVFGTKGAEKRAVHGSQGSTVFRDPNEEDRLWAIFDWDVEGWKSFVSDPDVPPIMKQAGHKAPPQAAELVGSYGALRFVAQGQARASGSALPLEQVLESRRYWILLAFTPIAIGLGKVAAPMCPRVLTEAFITGTEPTEVCPLHTYWN